MEATCQRCGMTDFEEINGAYWCTTCNTQNQTLFQVELDEDFDEGFAHTREIRSQKDRKKRDYSPGVLWTSHEAFNKILVSQVKVLEENCPQIPSTFRATVLGVWMSYLNECEVAFRDGSQSEPKLHPCSSHRDKRVFAYKEKHSISRFKCAGKSGEKEIRKRRFGKSILMDTFSNSQDGDSVLIEVVQHLPLATKESLIQFDNMMEKETRSQLKDIDLVDSYKLRLMCRGKSAEDGIVVDDDSDSEDDGQNAPLEESVLTVDNSSEMGSDAYFVSEREELAAEGPQEDEDIIISINEYLAKKSRDLVELVKIEDIRVDRSNAVSSEAFTNFMTLNKTLAILYIALRIVDVNIFISDLVHWAMQGHIPFFGAATELPEDWKVLFNDAPVFTASVVPSIQTIVIHSSKISRCIGFDLVPYPDLICLARRYLIDMNLPLDILSLIEDNELALDYLDHISRKKLSRYPHYEHGVLSLILVVLRKLFSLDGKNERSVCMVNDESDIDSFKWTNWEEWSRYRIHCIKNYYCPAFGEKSNNARDLDVLNIFYEDVAKDWRGCKVLSCPESYQLTSEYEARPDITNLAEDLVNEDVKPEKFRHLEIPKCSEHFLKDATNCAKSKMPDPDGTRAEYLSRDFTSKSLRGSESRDYVPLDLSKNTYEKRKLAIDELSQPVKLILVQMSWLANSYPFAFYNYISKTEQKLFLVHCQQAKKLRSSRRSWNIQF